MGAEFLKREGQVAAVVFGLAHAQDASRADLDAGGFEMPDRFHPVLVAVGSADRREKSLRTLQIVIVTFQSGLFETVGDALIPDDAQGSIGAGFATLLEFRELTAERIQNRAFVQSAPGGNQAESSNPVRLCFFGSGAHRFALNEIIARRFGLIGGRLGAKAAILGATAGLDIDNRAKVDLVSFEMLADPIGPGQQVENVGAGLQSEKPAGILAGNLASGDHLPSQAGDPLVMLGVKRDSAH